ncbi:MAG: lysophospholipid acyltransferase family protein [Alphaproteobacteria bacterium]|nr:lysophospholipid acyltransferase family protein [Alphaproteobacteria bacterium]
MTMTTVTEKDNTPIFSFADGEMGPISNAFIRGLERFTGQPKIKNIYLDYVNDDRPNHLFWQDAVERLKLDVNLDYEDGAYIPETGRLLIVANHPFGVIDGLILCSELSKVRQDFKIITHQVLRQAPAVMHQILPINFEESEAALRTNMQTRKDATKQVEDGGALVLFPAGAISLADKVIGPARDSEWKTFGAKLASIENTTILPVFFDGQNSLSYMFARKISQTLGYSLMFREICRRIGSRVDVKIRKPISSADLKQFDNRNAIINHLRDITYGNGA